MLQILFDSNFHSPNPNPRQVCLDDAERKRKENGIMNLGFFFCSAGFMTNENFKLRLIGELEQFSFQSFAFYFLVLLFSMLEMENAKPRQFLPSVQFE